MHNECFADVVDEEYIRTVCKPHEQGTPGVFIHCCMHTFRAVKNFDEYRKMLGVTTTRHEKSRFVEVKPTKPAHPIMKGFPAVFKTPVIEEVYVIQKVWPDCTPLATAYGVETKTDQPCVWVNRYGKARIFGTTLGHPTEMFDSEVFLDTLARGLLWTCDKLDAEGKPTAEYEPKAAVPRHGRPRRPRPENHRQGINPTSGARLRAAPPVSWVPSPPTTDAPRPAAVRHGGGWSAAPDPPT